MALCDLENGNRNTNTMSTTLLDLGYRSTSDKARAEIILFVNEQWALARDLMRLGHRPWGIERHGPLLACLEYRTTPGHTTRHKRVTV